VQEIKLRIAPELHFKLDNTLDEAARMDALISKTIADDERRRAEREKREQDAASEEEAGNENDR